MIVDYKDCPRNHYNNPGRIPGLEVDPEGLCYICIRDRSYAVQRHLGERFTGTVTYLDNEGAEQTLTISHGFTNAGFNGIVAYGTRGDGARVSPSAGAIRV